MKSKYNMIKSMDSKTKSRNWLMIHQISKTNWVV